MNSKRLQTIRAMLEKSPEDVFLQFSLGMELVKTDALDQAIDAFTQCTKLDEAYLPARVEMGKAQRTRGYLDDARTTLQDALAIAIQTNEPHVEDFIRQLLDVLRATPKA
jgi:tetratricopeptide (TPR) repeat protein